MNLEASEINAIRKHMSNCWVNYKSYTECLRNESVDG